MYAAIRSQGITPSTQVPAMNAETGGATPSHVHLHCILALMMYPDCTVPGSSGTNQKHAKTEAVLQWVCCALLENVNDDTSQRYLSSSAVHSLFLGHDAARHMPWPAPPCCWQQLSQSVSHTNVSHTHVSHTHGSHTHGSHTHVITSSLAS